MKVVWTEGALADLDHVLAYASEHYPTAVPALENRIRAIAERIGKWPESARLVENHSDVRVVPLVRFPYRIFYSVGENAVEILHLHHAARDD